MITDQAMPQMTGTQLIEAIRADRPDLPILLATGYAELPPGKGVGHSETLPSPSASGIFADAVDAAMRQSAQKAA